MLTFIIRLTEANALDARALWGAVSAAVRHTTMAGAQATGVGTFAGLFSAAGASARRRTVDALELPQSKRQSTGTRTAMLQ